MTGNRSYEQGGRDAQPTPPYQMSISRVPRLHVDIESESVRISDLHREKGFIKAFRRPGTDFKFSCQAYSRKLYYVYAGYYGVHLIKLGYN